MNHNEDIKKYLIGITEETYNSLMREVDTERKLNRRKEIIERFNSVRDDFKKLLEDFPTLEFYEYVECEDCNCEIRVELEDFLNNIEWCL